MRATLGTLVAAAALAVAAGGCGFGAGESSEGEAILTVTREYGAVPMVDATVSDPAESDTVIRVLDREAEITTRYGGGFVQSIEGVAGGIEDGRSVDWFFFVNGIESGRGGADVPVRAGDRIWWDFRDWTDALRTPAVVGSWPEPFAQAGGEEPLPVRIECAGPREPCDGVAGKLADEGVSAAVVQYGRAAAPEALRILVGEWSRISSDPTASLLESGPQRSGVFARFEPGPGRRPALVGLDERGEAAQRLAAGSGLVAALRDGEVPPAWVVSGTDADGVVAAVAALDAETLADRYAVAVPAAGAAVALPVREGA